MYAACFGEDTWWQGREVDRELGRAMAYVLLGGEQEVRREEIMEMGVQGLLGYMRG
ncbi:MAG: hypothetical protein VYA34_08710 [Myxococcota bacterium]|nr:hypothetical protein [Myxococcota bacterium]